MSVECSPYIIDNDGINGFLHIAGVAGSLVSIYWSNINIFDPSFVWDSVGYWGNSYGVET